MNNIFPQEQLYETLKLQLTELGVHDATDLADRLKLEIDPDAPQLHPLQLLRMCHDLCLEPLCGQDGFGDLTWRISSPTGLPHFTIEMERDDEQGSFTTKLPLSPAQIEADFDASELDGMVWDYIDQQDDEDRASIWQFIYEDCNEYIECMRSAQKIKEHPRLGELFLDAVAQGYDNAFQDGLDLGVDPNYTNNRIQSALHLSAKFGHARYVAPLVDAGARVDDACWGGLTPLHLAAQHSHADTCLALINHQADTSKLDRFGRSALHLAKGLSREQRQDL